MIGWIEGVAKTERVVLTAGGVGYTVLCPGGLPVGDHVELHVTTMFRQDAIELYGFEDVIDQLCFEALVKAPGVGPAIALGLVGGLGVSGVAAAIAGEDTKALTSVRGVGASLAKKILASVTLPDAVVAAAAGGASGPVGPADQDLEAVRTTLSELGFNPEAVDLAARAAREVHPDGTVEQLVAAAIANINAHINPAA